MADDFIIASGDSRSSLSSGSLSPDRKKSKPVYLKPIEKMPSPPIDKNDPGHQTPVCGAFLARVPCNLQGCPYLHEDPINSPPKALKQQDVQDDDSNICTHYAKHGWCRFEQACRYDHVQDKARYACFDTPQQPETTSPENTPPETSQNRTIESPNSTGAAPFSKLSCNAVEFRPTSFVAGKLADGSGGEAGNSGEPGGEAGKPCVYHAQSRCQFGETCRFAH